MNATESYRYRIDADERICEVSPAWLRFAAENEAPELTEAAVLGRSLWDFVVGEDTRRLYGLLFADLRARRGERRIPFRCDSPTLTRHMNLTLRGLAAGAIEMEGELLATEARPAQALLARHGARGQDELRICSLCRRIETQDAWLDIAEAIGRRRLFAETLPPRLVETTCPDCAALLAPGHG